MVFGMVVELFNPQTYQAYDSHGVPTKMKTTICKCTHCMKKIKPGEVIIKQHYTTRFGHGTHKWCQECTKNGLKELKETVKDVKFKSKIGWDLY